MNKKFEKLTTLLKELFQLDQPDLDFGLYRVMHAKSSEVAQFLDTDLLPQVQAALSQYKTADKSELETELARAIEQAQGLGADPESLPKVKELRAKLKTDAVDIGALESEVYDHLFSFFRRYYSEGDFLAKRVYKQGVYAIPYEGEEVALHWANKDQYYIKTSEYLRDYAFRLQPDDDKKPMRVHFRLTDATEGEHGNIKAAEGKDRVFILTAGGESGLDFIAQEEGDQGEELSLRFEYRPATLTDWPEDVGEGKKKPPAQKDLIALASRRVLAITQVALAPWIEELAQPHVTASGEKADITRLEAHLRRYTARNTFDYFIHKDLGGFLRRELDFYIKNEVIHLDDVESETAPRVEQFLSKIKIIRKIAGKIIAFLAQLEEFQKKLWQKKKFVVETQWCVTLDCVPLDFYAEIASNDAQREEWVRLFAIDEIRGELGAPAYSIPLDVAFLRANQHLLVDTRFFDTHFSERLLATLEPMDSKISGTLVHSDNFQAMQLVQGRMREQVKCVYIDPPYNTASSSIPYKNNYRHSSWASMMYDRLASLYPLLSHDGAIFVSIDKAERTILEHMLDDVFGRENRIEELIWSMNTNNSQAPNYSTNHEYVLVYAKDRRIAEQDRSMFREPKPGFEDVMSLMESLNPKYPTLIEIEKELKGLYDRHKMEYREEVEAQGLEWEDEKANDPWKGLFNYNNAEYRDADGKLVDEAHAKAAQARIWVWQEGDASMPATKQSPTTRDRNHPNWRWYKPAHPKTGKFCPHPKSGWKFAYDDDADSPDKRSFVSLDRDARIAWGPDETKVPRLKRMLHEVETNVGKSVFADYSDGEKQTSAMFGRSGVFLAPKHADFVSRFIQHAARNDSSIVDCFGGSGSTAHAVISLNRSDNGSRKFLLAEVGEYFDTVLKPRVVKALYSRDWRDGKPLSREGISSLVKVIRLESYEDALNNLEVHRTDKQQSLLDTSQAQGADGLKEQYLLRYLLDVETRGSQSLLNVRAFSDPTAYKLKVKRPGSDESGEVNVDLLETFNWLVGLTVQHISAPQIFSAAFERDSEKRLRLSAKSGGRLKQETDGPYWFRTVTGTTPNGRKALVIWRKLTGEPEQDNLVLDEWFTKQGYSSKDSEFDLIYVNGGNNLENLKTPDDRWKVRLLEEDFHRLMFATEVR
jgi:adenine-specific DNA-methyltransferase